MVKIDKAIHYLKIFLSLKNNNNLIGLKELIKCYIVKKEYFEAILLAGQAIEKFKDPESFTLRGLIYRKLNISEAEEGLHRIRKIKGEDNFIKEKFKHNL